jgi:enoyl-CoA hydratase/carnithine racemase
VVVALNGAVAGGALAWTLASDLVVASNRAELVALLSTRREEYDL